MIRSFTKLVQNVKLRLTKRVVINPSPMNVEKLRQRILELEGDGCSISAGSPSLYDTTSAIKHDEGKPRYDLIPLEALDGLARLYALGARKYADRNWEKGMQWSRIFAALMRHAWKWFRGERFDTEDGQHHMLSVIWCAMALYTYDVRNAGEDDRPGGIDPMTYDAVWRKGP